MNGQLFIKLRRPLARPTGCSSTLIPSSSPPVETTDPIVPTATGAPAPTPAVRRPLGQNPRTTSSSTLTAILAFTRVSSWLMQKWMP
jgi:hypothetical protein